jgi:predicted molibdopterin-dependent oxidoreductase YjgC
VNTAFLGNVGDVAAQLRQLDLLVVQHLFMNETAQYAHVVLPTTAFGEEEVTFTSTDRRLQLAERVVDPPAGLTSAWEQIADVARRMGADWNYESAGEVMEEIGEVVPSYSGANYQNLAREYGRQWPCTKDRPLGTRFLFAENSGGQTFKFVPIPKPPQPEPAPKDFPLTLVFGNSIYYWNQNVVVRHSETLKREYRILMLDYPQGFVELNTDDAKQLGIRDGKRIRLCAANSSSTATARVTSEVMSGTIFVPHFMRDVEKQILGATGDGRRLIPVRVEKEAA